MMKVYSGNPGNRRSMRLRLYDYSQGEAYFITICAWQWRCLFGKIANGEIAINEFGMIARGCWNLIPEHFPNTELDEYIVMPNHIHGIINIVGARHAVPLQVEKFGKPVAGSIPTIIRSYKSAVTKRINDTLIRHRLDVWQRNYYEHIIRDEIELNRIREYIIHNPLRWELDIENPQNSGGDTRAYYDEIVKIGKK